MKILIALALTVLTSGCAVMDLMFPAEKVLGYEELMAKYHLKEHPIESATWVPPVGADSYCSPFNSAGGYCVHNVGGRRTRCDTYASGAMVCNTD